MKQRRSTYTVEEIKRKMEAYCAYQERCHKDIESRLKQMDLIPEVREAILLHLLEQDFLNEERFARSFARGKFRIKKWGRSRIERALKSKDISSYNIATGLSEIEEEEYQRTLFELAERKFEATREDHVLKKRKKVADHLLRKGFESDRVYAVLLELEKENHS